MGESGGVAVVEVGGGQGRYEPNVQAADNCSTDGADLEDIGAVVYQLE